LLAFRVLAGSVLAWPKAVANAKVTLTEANTNVSRATQTNSSGNYTFPNVPEGTYSMTIEAPGFKKEIRENIRVDVNTSARVDAQLQPGNLNQSIEVTAAPPPLQTDRADTTVTISTLQTASLPLSVNRNFQSLLNLVPGTAPATFQHSQFFNAESSLQTEVKLNRQFSNGLLITTALTWGKGLSYQIDDDGAFLFYINFRRNYARTDFDRTFTYVRSFVYQLPWGKGQRWMNSGLLSTILGNWQLAGIISAYTGAPLTFTVGGNNNNGGNLKAPGNTQTPNQIAPIHILHGINTNPWLTTSSFAQPTGAVFGTLGRNVISGPGLFAFNLSLFKDFKITERWQFELRCDSFNLTNTPGVQFRYFCH
jgi:Carboxypeptidase regulatory-like domain